MHFFSGTQDVGLRSMVKQADFKKINQQTQTVKAGVQKAAVEVAEEGKKGLCTSVALGSWLNMHKKPSCS